MRLAARLLVAAAVVVGAAWSTGAIFYKAPFADAGRAGAAAIVVAGSLIVVRLVFTRAALKAVGAWLVVFLAIVGWWQTLQADGMPRRAGAWAPDVARLPVFTIDGDRVTVDNVRAFRWTGEYQAQEHWARETYSLDAMRTLDVFFSTWGAPGIAHVILSFGFADGRHLALSTEVRRQAGEEFSSIAGFFKYDELAIIAADENDIIRVRTDYRGEDVSLYPIDIAPATVRRLFLDYAAEATQVARHPAFYNTVTDNCTTVPWTLSRAEGAFLPLDWRVLASAYGPDYLYANNFLSHRLTLAQTKRRATISAFVPTLPMDVDIGAAIRAHVAAP